MKKLTSTLIAAGVIAGASVSAPVMAEGPSMNVNFTNDYIWRGVSQSDNLAAAQGGLDWEMDKWSFGVWGSSLGTTGGNTGDGAEIDVYGAYNFGSVYVGAIYYYYGGSPTDFYEVNVGGDVGPVGLQASYDLKNSVYYVEGSGSIPVGKASIDLHVGYGESYTTASGGAALDYSIAVTGSAAGLDLGLGYWKSDTVTDNEGKVFVNIGKSM
jgi:uncharacterized protein (TIGR02001 family)